MSDAPRPWSRGEWDRVKRKLRRRDLPQVIRTMDVLYEYLGRTSGMVGIVMAEEIAAELGLRAK